MRNREIVLVEFSPSGGLFHFAVRLGTSLAERGEDVTLLTGPDPEVRETVPGMRIRPVLPTWHPATGPSSDAVPNVVRRGTRALRLVAAWLVLAGYLVRARPDVVLWSNWRFAFEPLFVVAISSALPRTVLGIVAHEPLPRSDARDTSTPRTGRFLLAAFAAAWRRMDVVYVLGRNAREVVLANWEPRGEVAVIPHGPVSVFGAYDRTTSAAETDRSVLCFGTLTRYKGIESLLDAFREVRASVPDARLVLAGAVSADLDIESVTALAGAVGNVDLSPGYVDPDDVPALLRRARVVVTPYLRASQSGVIHLAYSYGRPVITTDVGDLADSVEDGVTGLVVPPGDVSALARAITRLLLDPALAGRLGTCGYDALEGTGEEAARRVTEVLDRCGSRAGKFR